MLATATSLLLAGLAFLPWLRTPAAASFFARADLGQMYPAQFLAYRLGLSLESSVLVIVSALVLLVAVLFLAAYALMTNPRTQTSLRTSRLLRALSAVTLCVLLAASVVPRAYSVKRFTLLLWPFALIAMGWVFPWGRPTLRTLRVLLLLSLLLTIINVSLIPKDQWREAVAYIHAHQLPNDATWLLSDYLRVPYLYYDRAQTHWAGVSPQMSDEELEQLLRSSRRVWLVYQAIDIQIIDPTRRVEQWLQGNATPISQLKLFRVTLRLWEVD